jgi:hypothetical protein
MWMANKNGEECPAEPAESESLAETQPTLRHAFRHVYGFILQAVRAIKPLRMQFLRIILLESSPKNCCQFRAVASAQIKQAHLGARSRKGIGGSRDN